MAATKAQHLSALQSADAIRFARAEVRRAILAGELTVAEVLSPDHVPGIRHLEPVAPAVASLAVHKLLTWGWRWGDIRARKLLEELRIGERTPLGALTDRQRWGIVAALTGQACVTEAGMAATKAQHLSDPPDDNVPPALRVECPYCGANPGQRCATYDPVRDKWHEPTRPHGPRVKAAAKRA